MYLHLRMYLNVPDPLPMDLCRRQRPEILEKAKTRPWGPVCDARAGLSELNAFPK